MVTNNTAEGVFLNLVASFINDKVPSALPEGITADDIFEIGSRQDMAPITFCAMNSISPKPYSKKWGEYQVRFYNDCTRSEIQMSEYEKLVEYLCSKGVKLIPLKGCVIKKLYPDPNLRVMSDVDLLYEGITEKKLSLLMKDLDYSTEMLKSGCHDIFKKKPCMNIELHRKLTVDYSEHKPMLENMFDKAVADEKTENLYHMRPEDLYLHIISHAARHFIDSGLGVRPVLDIYVLNKKFNNSWNRKYIEMQLSSVGLERFEKKLQDIAYAFFGEEEKEVSDEDMDVFFQGGAYGYSEAVGRRSYLAEGGKSKIKYFLNHIFYPYPKMREKYPLLGKWPLLLPFAWGYRVIGVLIHKRNDIVDIATAKISKESSDQIIATIHRFGLD